jgi:hypothetical protein
LAVLGILSACSAYALIRVASSSKVMPHVSRIGAAAVALGVSAAWVGAITAATLGMPWWLSLVMALAALWIGVVAASVWLRRRVRTVGGGKRTECD